MTRFFESENPAAVSTKCPPSSLGRHNINNIYIFRSAMATSDLYAGITLLLPDPGKVFPGEFDPHRPWDTMILDCVSQEEFSDAVYKANGIAAVPLEFFLEDPELERGVRTPDSVELRDGGTYVMIPRKQDIPDKPVSCFALHVVFPQPGTYLRFEIALAVFP